MAVSKSIFAVEGEKASKGSAGSFADDVVGAFKVGYLNSKGEPESLAEWLVRTDDPDVAEAISGLYGGEPQESGNDRHPVEVFTETPEVRIVVAPSGIRSGFALWGNRALVQRCDGEVITWSADSPEDVGSPCACAGRSSEDRKKKAKNGTGCKPDVSILFSLVDAPDLGKFRMQSGSEILLRDIQDVEDAVNAKDEPSKLSLAIERVTTKAGFTFSKIVVAVIR